jgi:hypothetical protein
VRTPTSSRASSIGPRCENLFQEPKPTMQTIDGIPVERRASSIHRHRHPSALGELMCPAAPIRVSSLLALVGGRRRLGAVDHNLIGRPQLPSTPSVFRPLTAGPCLAGRLTMPFPCAAGERGRNPADRPRSGPLIVFFGKTFNFLEAL